MPALARTPHHYIIEGRTPHHQGRYTTARPRGWEIAGQGCSTGDDGGPRARRSEGNETGKATAALVGGEQPRARSGRRAGQLRGRGAGARGGRARPRSRCGEESRGPEPKGAARGRDDNEGCATGGKRARKAAARSAGTTGGLRAGAGAPEGAGTGVSGLALGPAGEGCPEDSDGPQVGALPPGASHDTESVAEAVGPRGCGRLGQTGTPEPSSFTVPGDRGSATSPAETSWTTVPCAPRWKVVEKLAVAAWGDGLTSPAEVGGGSTGEARGTTGATRKEGTAGVVACRPTGPGGSGCTSSSAKPRGTPARRS